MHTILCYGDSNTWGAVPNEARRFGPAERWPAVMRGLLGEGYWVIEEGLPGRTTVWDDPVEDHKNGLRYLQPCLDSHQPDLVILLLGTNDLKHRFGLGAWDIAAGAGKLAGIIRRSEPWPKPGKTECILVCPPPIIETGWAADMFAGGAETSLRLAPHYEAFARETGSRFVDAGAHIASCPSEGIHWEASAHRIFAEVMARELRSVFGN